MSSTVRGSRGDRGALDKFHEVKRLTRVSAVSGEGLGMLSEGGSILMSGGGSILMSAIEQGWYCLYSTARTLSSITVATACGAKVNSNELTAHGLSGVRIESECGQ